MSEENLIMTANTAKLITIKKAAESDFFKKAMKQIKESSENGMVSCSLEGSCGYTETALKLLGFKIQSHGSPRYGREGKQIGYESNMFISWEYSIDEAREQISQKNIRSSSGSDDFVGGLVLGSMFF